MKTSGWVASAIGAVVLVGGGIWGVNALTASDDGTVTAVEETQAPTETPEPVETATVEPDESVEPAPEETVTPEYTELEQLFVDWARPLANSYIANIPELDEMSDEELLTAIHVACEAQDSGEADIVVEMPETDELGHLKNPSPEAYAAKDLNLLFIQAAQLGPDPSAAEPISYCDDM